MGTRWVEVAGGMGNDGSALGEEEKSWENIGAHWVRVMATLLGK